jgi:hypothetical protein
MRADKVFRCLLELLISMFHSFQFSVQTECLFFELDILAFIALPKEYLSKEYL